MSTIPVAFDTTHSGNILYPYTDIYEQCKGMCQT